MRKFLHFVQHLVFVILIVLVVSIIGFNTASYKTIKGDYEATLTNADANKTFKDSTLFNQMFGASISDVIDYAGIQNLMDSEEYKLSISGNNILNDGPNDKLHTTSSKYGDYLSASNSNIRFFVETADGNSTLLRTNVNDSKNTQVLKDYILNNCDKYVFLDALNGKYETNTLIKQETIYKLFANSSYEFSNDTTIMVGINKNIDVIEDNFAKVNKIYSIHMSYYNVKLVAIIICIFIYLLILLYLTVVTGVRVNKETGKKSIKLTEFDGIAIEIRLLLLFGLYAVFCFIFIELSQINISKYALDNLSGFFSLVVILALILSMIISFFYYGFIRRFKAKAIWKTSITRKIFVYIEKATADIRGNKGIIIKSVIPLALIVMFDVLFCGIIIRRTYGHMFNFIIVVIFAIVNTFAIYLIYRNTKERYNIINVLKAISDGNISAKVNKDDLHGDNIALGEAVNNIGKSVEEAVKISMKDEKMKTDLITNVSHDLKTPLTSIINYVDLLKKENINNENATHYIAILDEKSQRLKQLTDDLVEASKISSGNIVLQMEKINVKELISMALAEFVDKFEEKGLSSVATASEDNYVINADSRSSFRILENLYTNIYKYALQGTRVYIDLTKENGKVNILIKNISANPLNISTDELMERFVRGDESRNTEGSGLGLSIAKNLTEAMGGTFDILLDGDLFKVILTFDECNE